MTENLTKLPGVPDSATIIPGMAFLAGTGPAGATCGVCKHRGYERESSNGTYNETTNEMIYRTYRVKKCAKFRQLAGFHGADIERDNAACKFFTAKK